MSCLPAGAQALADGYDAAVAALPGGAGFPAVLPNGTAWFTGTDLQLLANGQPVRTLLSYPSSVFGAFTLPLGSGVLLFADSSFGQLWRVPTAAGATPTQLGSLVLPYDAVLAGPATAIVSAKTGGFGAVDNDLLALDLTTGATTWLGSVPGASGAVEFDSQGGLIYATAPAGFPPPAGTVQILRWTSVQLTAAMQGALPLSAQNAQVLLAGIDAASDLALDADDDLLFVDWLNDRVGEINELHQVAWRTDLIDYAGGSVAPAALQFLAGSGGQFEPFAPAGGGELVVHETDFASVSQLRRVVARRAAIAAAPSGVVPAGPLVVRLQQGPRQGFGLVALALAGAQSPLSLAVPGFEQTLPWDQALLAGATTLVGFDAQGAAQVGYTNPGFPLGLQVLVAGAFVDAGGSVLGSTAALPVMLGN